MTSTQASSSIIDSRLGTKIVTDAISCYRCLLNHEPVLSVEARQFVARNEKHVIQARRQTEEMVTQTEDIYDNVLSDIQSAGTSISGVLEKLSATRQQLQQLFEETQRAKVTSIIMPINRQDSRADLHNNHVAELEALQVTLS
eukprot:gene8341-881_t